MIKKTTMVVPLLLMLSASAAAQGPALNKLLEVTELLQRDMALSRETVEAAVEPGKPAAKEAHVTREPQAKESGLSHARDPFALTTLMLQSGGSLQGGEGVAGKLPALRLRGLAQRSGEPGLALIEVEGIGIYMLRIGEIVTIRSEQNPLTLRLKRIHSGSVEIESGAGQQVVVR